MMKHEEYLSPDGALRLLVLRDGSDITIGFDGYPWHTHGDVVAGEVSLAGEPGYTPDAAARRLVEDILTGRVPIALTRRGGKLQQIVATYLFGADDPYDPDDEYIELRRWDGSPWEVS